MQCIVAAIQMQQSRYPTYTMRGEDPVMDWSLVIEKVTLEDDGIFQCQVLHHVIPTIKLTDE